MRKKRKHIRLLAVTGVLVVTAGVLFAGRNVVIEQMKVKTVKEISKKVLSEQLGAQAGPEGWQEEVSQVIDQMEAEDVETLTDIAQKYISPENIRQAAELAASGDLEKLQDLAEDQVSGEDQAKLQELYEKYRTQVP